MMAALALQAQPHFAVLASQLAAQCHPSSVPYSGTNLSPFNPDKDKRTFYPREQKWDAHLIAFGFDQIENEEDKVKLVQS
jgi:hypothetical protein